MVHISDGILGKIDFLTVFFFGRWLLVPCDLFILFITVLYDHYQFIRYLNSIFSVLKIIFDLNHGAYMWWNLGKIDFLSPFFVEDGS